ncbi:MAG: LysR substrate-binding domain-containing protein [Candidatus Dechloromonas phosphoritropha]
MTAAGEELLLTVRDFDDAWNRLESATDDLKSFKRGKLRVGLVTTAKHALPHMLGDLFWHSPEIDIELEIANRQRIVERLFGNQDDLGVMSYPPANLDIVSQPFLDNEYVVLAPAAHWAVGKALRLQELGTEHFLLREEGSGSRHVIDPHMRDTGIQWKVRLLPASDEAIRELVASGIGLTVLSRQALGDRPGRDGLAILDVAGFPLNRRWSVVHLRGKILSLPAMAFLADLLHSAAGDRTSAA